jgi:hemerythrin-like domain-containing protein
MTPAAETHPRALRPTDVLKHEHRRIEERLATLSEALELLGDRGAEVSVLDRIEEIATLIDREMAVHHQKEEEGLFPVLGPYLDRELNLDGRIADHEDLKIMSGKFQAAIDECRADSNDLFAAQMLRGYGLYIVHLVLEHLLKEDQILFLVAEHCLSAEEEEEVFRRFGSIETTDTEPH